MKMQKVFGILVIVLGVWVGMEVYTKGTHAAFGGIFASFVDTPPHEVRSPLQKIEDRGAQARDRQLGRIERQLDDSRPAD